MPQASDFLHGSWLVLRKGKRNIAGATRSMMSEIVEKPVYQGI